MTDEKLEQQLKEMTEKVRKRDEEAFKSAEQEWRKEMERDTGGHTFKAFQLLQAQIANLDAQLVAANPIVALARQNANLDARMTMLEAKKVVEEKPT